MRTTCNRDRKVWIGCLLAAPGVLGVCLGQAAPYANSTASAPHKAAVSPRLDARRIQAEIDPYLREAVAQRRFSGVVLIAQNGKPLVRKAYGYADWTQHLPNRTDTRFMLYSVTKQFTATAILILQDRGLLDVHKSIRTYLPECPPEWQSVTVHHLLTHTSGIDTDNLYFWIAEHYPAFREDPDTPMQPFQSGPLLTPPGSAFHYSNAGYMLLSILIGRVSGLDYETFLRENIFQPLQMNATGCDHDHPTPKRARGHELTSTSAAISEQPTHFIVGAGDIYTTADDMLKWDQSFYGSRLLSEPARKAMFTGYIPTRRGGYGYGWQMSTNAAGRVLQMHTGGGAGFTSWVMRRPSEHIYLIVLCNVSSDAPFPYADGCLSRIDALLDQTSLLHPAQAR